MTFVAQAFTGVCQNHASGSDRIRKSPRIKEKASRKRITENRAEMNFGALPDPVATARGSDTPGNERGLGLKSPINGASMASPVSHPGRKRLGERKFEDEN
jgi:hypothetical protein